MVEVIVLSPREINDVLHEFSSLNELQYFENTIIDLHRLKHRSDYVIHLLSLVFTKLEDSVFLKHPSIRKFLHGSKKDYVVLEVRIIDSEDEEHLIFNSITNMETSSIAKEAFDLMNYGYRIEVEDLIEEIIMVISKVSRLLFQSMRSRGKVKAAFYTEGGLIVCVPMIDL